MQLSLRIKFLIPLLTGGILMAFLGAWAAHQAALDQLRDQVVKRGDLLGSVLNEAAKATQSDDEIRFAVEEIVGNESGVYGIAVATKAPTVIWASSFRPGTDEDELTQSMLLTLRQTLSDGIFGHYFAPDGDLITLIPLSLRAAALASVLEPTVDERVSKPRLGDVTDSPDYSWGSRLRVPAAHYRGAIYLRFDWDSVKQATGNILWRSVIIMLMGIALMGVLAYWLLHRTVLKPMAVIGTAMQYQKQGKDKIRVPAQDNDEIGQLGMMFNQMLDTILERDRRFRTVVDHLPIAVSLKSIDGRYELTNHKHEQWFCEQRTDENSISKPETGAHDDLSTTRAQQERQVIDIGEPVTWEEQWLASKGEHRVFLTTLFPVFNAMGQLNTIGSASTDITERKRAEQEIQRLNEVLGRRVEERTANLQQAVRRLDEKNAALVQAEQQLREREMRLRAVLDNVVDGIITIDEHSRILSVNPALEAMFGYEARELLGRSVTQLMPEKQREPHGSAMESHLQSSTTHAVAMKLEVEGLCKDGAVFPIELTVSEADLGNQRLFTGVLRDITDRKLAEDELKQRRRHLEALVEQRTVRLQDANDELKRFAYIVSHDLRAPLVNIKGFTEELRLTTNEIRSLLEPVVEQLDMKSQKELDGLLGADINESMGFIDSSIKKMDRQINAILKLSRLGRLQLKPERIDTLSLVKDALRSMAHEIDEQGIRVEVDELPALVADRMAMEQIVSNILDNAIKYLDPGRAGLIAVYGEHSGGNTVLHFRDNGRGISSQEQNRVFELFGRAGSQDRPGEGMGLAYVQSFVRKMGGRIWCESELGRGTVFSVALPQL